MGGSLRKRERDWSWLGKDRGEREVGIAKKWEWMYEKRAE